MTGDGCRAEPFSDAHCEALKAACAEDRPRQFVGLHGGVPGLLDGSAVAAPQRVFRMENHVNAVGVDANTASAPLLARVSGIGAGLAESIVQHRDANGPFKSRGALKEVPRLGAKAFEQCDVIISGGLGCSIAPLRIGVPPEIVLVTLGGADTA